MGRRKKRPCKTHVGLRRNRRAQKTEYEPLFFFSFLFSSFLSRAFSITRQMKASRRHQPRFQPTALGFFGTRAVSWRCLAGLPYFDLSYFHLTWERGKAPLTRTRAKAERANRAAGGGRSRQRKEQGQQRCVYKYIYITIQERTPGTCTFQAKKTHVKKGKQREGTISTPISRSVATWTTHESTSLQTTDDSDRMPSGIFERPPRARRGRHPAESSTAPLSPTRSAETMSPFLPPEPVCLATGNALGQEHVFPGCFGR